MFAKTLRSAATFVMFAALAAATIVVPAAHAHYVPPPENPGVAALPEPQDFGGIEQVASFVANIVVNRDGTITVTEHIDYVFPESRHGIYRDIPTRYDMDDGTLVEVPVEITEVLGSDDRPVPYEVTRNKVGLRIKIGDPDVMISGSQSYDISYTARGALRYFEDHDELYWNVTGNSWEVPIRRVIANVTLPMEAADVKGVTNKCFTGEAGSKESNCVFNAAGNDTFSFAANEPMTIVLGWPPGIVAHLEARRIGIAERAMPFLPLLLPIVALIVMFNVWSKHGRDPKGRSTHMVEYDPPDKLTPAETGTLLDGRAGNNDISAIIVDLAVRGYLVIREIEEKGLILKSKDYEFERIKEYANDSALKPFEKKMLDALFPDGGKLIRTSDIKKEQKFYKEREKVAAGVYDELVQGGYYAKNPNKVKLNWVGVGIVTIVAAFVIGMGLMPITGEVAGGMTVFGLVISGFIVLAFAPFMPKTTEKGALAKDQAVGFKDYLATAEKYRLQWQEKEGIFERFLPYAMAYGVADKWAKAFASMHLPPPTWYQGSAVQAGLFNPMLFASSMRDMNTHAVAAMTSMPSSSSSGSGFSGSSGGGFGGGGGGSW